MGGYGTHGGRAVLAEGGGTPAPEATPFRYGAVGRKTKGSGRAEIGGVMAARKREGCMFGLFNSEPIRDGQLGEFRRSSGYWKGSLVIASCGTFRSALAGSREAPNPIALGLAKESPDRFKSLMPKIQTGLFEHYAQYKEAVDAGEETGSPCPSVASSEAVWPHVTPAHVLVEPLEGIPTVEIAFKVAWDIEHTLGARFQNWQFIELNGSVRGQ
jgi:hypothetical protein